LKAAHSLSYSLSRTPIRDKDFKGFLDGKKTSIMAHVIYFLSLKNEVEKKRKKNTGERSSKISEMKVFQMRK